MRRLLVLLILLAGCSAKRTDAPTTTVATGPVEVGRWKGDADADTESFTVEDTWELHWAIAGEFGSSAGVAWYVPGDELPSGSLLMPDGEGSFVIREGGTFYLQITTFGSQTYEIWAVDVPN